MEEETDEAEMRPKPSSEMHHSEWTRRIRSSGNVRSANTNHRVEELRDLT